MAEVNVLENMKSSHWQQKHPGAVFLYLKLSMMNFSPEGFLMLTKTKTLARRQPN